MLYRLRNSSACKKFPIDYFWFNKKSILILLSVRIVTT